MRQRIALIIAVGVMCLLTSCKSGGTTGGNTLEGPNLATEKPVQDYVFTRPMAKVIPEGYTEEAWSEEVDTPIDILEEYSMVRQNATDMLGVVDYDGNVVVEAKYSDLTFVYAENDMPYFQAVYEETWGVVDGTGAVTVPFDSSSRSYIRLTENIMLRFLDGAGVVTCVTYDVTEGEIGSFDIAHDLPDETWNIPGIQTIPPLTVLGPNDWVFPVTHADGKFRSQGIKNYQGETLSEEEIYFQSNGLGSPRSGTSTKNGYSCQPVTYVTDGGKENYQYYIFNKNGEKVAGPYTKAYQEGEVFMCQPVGKGNSQVIYSPAHNQEYPADALKGYRLVTTVDVDKVLCTNAEGIYLYDIPTSAQIQIRQDKPEEFGEENTYSGGYNSYIELYGESLVYMSNGTYKVSDMVGKDVADERYYGVQDTGFGLLLKKEDGTWGYLKENGEFSTDESKFMGNGENADTYDGYPIVGFWEYEGIPCVVIEKDGQQWGHELR